MDRCDIIYELYPCCINIIKIVIQIYVLPEFNKYRLNTFEYV